MYRGAVRLEAYNWYGGLRKSRFIDILNCISQQAPLCGLNVPFTHGVVYGRLELEGLVKHPDSTPPGGESTSIEGYDLPPRDEPYQRKLSTILPIIFI